MQRLRDLGIQHLVMLTGDNEDVAHRIADSRSASPTSAAELLPEHKVDAIRELRRNTATSP